jgi:hypothetical protein
MVVDFKGSKPLHRNHFYATVNLDGRTVLFRFPAQDACGGPFQKLLSYEECDRGWPESGMKTAFIHAGMQRNEEILPELSLDESSQSSQSVFTLSQDASVQVRRTFRTLCLTVAITSAT